MQRTCCLYWILSFFYSITLKYSSAAAFPGPGITNSLEPSSWTPSSHMGLDSRVNLAPLNIGLVITAYRRGQNRQAWSTAVGTTTSDGSASRRRWCRWCCSFSPHGVPGCHKPSHGRRYQIVLTLRDAGRNAEPVIEKRKYHVGLKAALRIISWLLLLPCIFSFKIDK